MNRINPSRRLARFGASVIVALFGILVAVFAMHYAIDLVSSFANHPATR